jgi:hypothetical protein
MFLTLVDYDDQRYSKASPINVEVIKKVAPNFS